ncbi:hypothetical protein ABIA35_008118 [Catenulispora sp. MAP12-49]|uniref:histone-like nucleoid-structuring protein Lsr2 n=1 Tax=Catenulispora sp. MAP12-49 TaxID=3156302 RepID=UPI0035180278
MARKTTIEVFDDLDGSKDATTVKFSLDGKQYEIDLNGKNEKQLRAALEKYVAAATPVRASASAIVAGRVKSKGTLLRRDTKHIRAWLRDQGVEISDRGRISTDLMQRYESAHSG